MNEREKALGRFAGRGGVSADFDAPLDATLRPDIEPRSLFALVAAGPSHVGPPSIIRASFSREVCEAHSLADGSCRTSVVEYVPRDWHEQRLRQVHQQAAAAIVEAARKDRSL